ncbi:MAG: hypothetical protein EBR82_16940 [Caulobacteraceae bacterium]|nr:hypothetical protein [Caulobacteraceae bacterium]
MDQVVNEFSGASYFLALVMSGFASCLWWFATHILIPVRDDHREFLKKLDRNLERLTEQVEALPCRMRAEAPTYLRSIPIDEEERVQ